MRVGKLISSTWIVSTDFPQGCVIPLTAFVALTDYTLGNQCVKLLKFAYRTTVISPIPDSNKSAYRKELEQLDLWWSHNSLELNTLKTVEMTLDFTGNNPNTTSLTTVNSTEQRMYTITMTVRIKC